MLAGAAQGLFFHRAEWLGGYESWRRRLMRLGHVSFFGLAFVNLAFAVTLRSVGVADAATLPSSLAWSSTLLIVGAVSMPLVCYLSAWRQAFRHLFFVPVGSLLVGVLLPIVWRLQASGPLLSLLSLD